MLIRRQTGQVIRLGIGHTAIGKKPTLIFRQRAATRLPWQPARLMILKTGKCFLSEVKASSQIRLGSRAYTHYLDQELTTTPLRDSASPAHAKPPPLVDLLAHGF